MPLRACLARYATSIADDDVVQALVRDGKLPLRYLPYDWRLNDISR